MDKWIIAGDLNGVMDRNKDRTGIGCKQGCIPICFKEWLRLHELVDIWRYCNGDQKDYMFYSGRHNNYIQELIMFLCQDL